MPLQFIKNDKIMYDAQVMSIESSYFSGCDITGTVYFVEDGKEKIIRKDEIKQAAPGEVVLQRSKKYPTDICINRIYMVIPDWQGGDHGGYELLKTCIRGALRLAETENCQSILFPINSVLRTDCLKEQAYKILTNTIYEYLQDHELMIYLEYPNLDNELFSRLNIMPISNDVYTDIQKYIDDNDDDTFPACRESKAAEKIELTHGSNEGFWNEKSRKAKNKGIIRKKEKTGTPLPNVTGLPSLEEYLYQMDEGFRDMLFREIDARQITDVECYKRANIDRKLFNKIKNLPDYKPGKPTVLALAVSLRLSLDETQEFLRKAGFSLTHSSKFDLIVEYFIQQRCYNIFEINEALFAFDQKLLGSPGA